MIIFYLPECWANEDCSAAIDHSAQRDCLIRAEQASRAALAREVKSIEARIAMWNEDSDEKARSLADFRLANRRYQAFRSAQCEFEASVAAGGNGAGEMRLECQISLDDGRIKLLKEQALRFRPPGA